MDLVADLLHFSIKDMEDISGADDVLSDRLPGWSTRIHSLASSRLLEISRSMEVAGKAEWNPGRSIVANARDTHGCRVTVTEGPWTGSE